MTFNFDDFVVLILSFTIFDKIGSVFGFNVLCYDFVEVGKCSLKAFNKSISGLEWNCYKVLCYLSTLDR